MDVPSKVARGEGRTYVLVVMQEGICKGLTSQYVLGAVSACRYCVNAMECGRLRNPCSIFDPPPDSVVIINGDPDMFRFLPNLCGKTTSISDPIA